MATADLFMVIDIYWASTGCKAVNKVQSIRGKKRMTQSFYVSEQEEISRDETKEIFS
jgi:hypothetical protein